MEKSGIVTYLCKIDNKKYILTTIASENIYTAYGYTFSSIIDCINYIDKVAFENTSAKLSSMHKSRSLFCMEI